MLSLKEFRIENGMLQKDLAKVLNRSITCISDWERGKREPSIDDLVRIADLFGITVDALLNRENYATGNVEIIGEILPDSEKCLLDLIRTLTNEQKKRAFHILKAAFSKQEK